MGYAVRYWGSQLKQEAFNHSQRWYKPESKPREGAQPSVPFPPWNCIPAPYQLHISIDVGGHLTAEGDRDRGQAVLWS